MEPSLREMVIQEKREDKSTDELMDDGYMTYKTKHWDLMS